MNKALLGFLFLFFFCGKIFPSQVFTAFTFPLVHAADAPEKKNSEADEMLARAKELLNNDPSKSLGFAEKAIRVYEKSADETGMAEALTIAGMAADNRSDFGAALNYYLQSLRIYEKLGDKSNAARILGNIGRVYMYQKEYALAISYCNKSYSQFAELRDFEGQAEALNNIGAVYYEQDSLEKTEEYMQLALSIFEQHRNMLGVAATSNNLGSIALETGETAKALRYFLQSLKTSEEIEDDEGIATVLLNIGNVYEKEGRFMEAESYCRKSIEKARSLNAKELVLSGYEALAGILYRSGKFAEAYEFQKNFSLLRDSVFSDESNRAMADMLTKYETEKKENLIRIQDSDIKLQRTFRNWMIAVLLLVSALAFFIYRGYVQKKKSNVALADAYRQIELKNKDITDSIVYAQRIQQAILPSEETIRSALPDSFILFKPKDVVSGDFYFLASHDQHHVLAAVDCTGHGVPGAFMSLIGSEMLHKIVVEQGITSPMEILGLLDKGVTHALQQDGKQNSSRDGMDIALCSFSRKENILSFAGAMRPLVIARKNGEGSYHHEEIKGSKFTIGGYSEKKLFREHTVNLNEGDSVFIFSDGYADQFGGADGKKFMTSNFRKLLNAVAGLPSQKQKEILEEKFSSWKNGNEQVDDVLVIGIKR